MKSSVLFGSTCTFNKNRDHSILDNLFIMPYTFIHNVRHNKTGEDR